MTKDKKTTRQVTPDDDGIRPAGPPDACFYCKRKVGMYHALECVTLRKKRRVRLHVEYEVEVPQDWDPSMVLFHRNESSWCAGNAIGELEELYGDDCDECGCSAMEFDVWDWENEEWLCYADDPIVVEVQGPPVAEALPTLLSAPAGTRIDVGGGSCEGKWLRAEDVTRGFTRVFEGQWINLTTGEFRHSNEFLDATGIVFEIAE